MISQITTPTTSVTLAKAVWPEAMVAVHQADNPHVDAATAQAASASINKFLQQYNLQFSVDADTKTQIVKVVDSATQEVIRQMPSQEMIAISKALDKFQGLLLTGKA